MHLPTPDKILQVPRYSGGFSVQDTPVIQHFMDRSDKYALEVENWEKYREKPVVSFSVAWREDSFFLKFFVSEPVARGIFTRDNEPVYRDSCVEFFFATGKDGPYYNIETNCIGTCLAQKGTSRYDRKFIDPGTLKNILRFPSLGWKPFAEKTGPVSWNLLLMIPLGKITGGDINTLEGKTFYANFYKCGDDLSLPHYLSWNPVNTEQPDFHRPEYFAPVECV